MDINLSEIVAEGHRAKAFQDSGEYQKAFAVIMTNLVSALIDIEDADARNEVWRQIQSLQAIDRHFLSMIEDGEMAQDEINRLEEAENK